MALNHAQTAGIIVAIIVFALTIVASIIIYRNRNVAPAKHSDDTEGQHTEPELQLPGPLQHHGTRQTQPQTFYDWVRSSNTSTKRYSSTTTTKPLQPQQQGHDRFPSLENGPGPIIHSRPKVTHRSTTPITKLKLERPDTSDSVKASSLRQAVLDVGDSKGEEDGRKAEENLEGKARPKGYTGAWP